MYKEKTILFVILLLQLLMACGQEKAPIKIGTNVWPGYEPLYLASETGLLPKSTFALVELLSASQVMRGLASQTLDVATLTLDEAIILQSRGVDIKIVMVLDYSNGGDALVADKSIREIAQLRGKRVAVEESAVGGYFLSRALELNNMKTSDLTVVSKLQHEMAHAFSSHEVDAVVTFDPIKSRLLHNNGVVLFDSRQIPGEIVDVLVVRDEVYEQIKEPLDVLKSAWYKSLKMIRSDPEKALPIVNQRLKLDKKTLSLVMDGVYFPVQEENLELMEPDKSTSLHGAVARVKGYLEKNNRITGMVNVEEMF
ncbi:MAG: ABC transporter substrate-binding protein [Gammaproteobacteria bacterium]|nr:ABC transporter substrate-binding protein [Gammaproteobacteria bacterium]